MIPKDIRPGATPQALDGATQKFTIEANGIAFRSLIDGLYSNKILAVIRELCSNARDSHIAAKQDKPFTVTIPTSLDPTFSVRDYGTSLSHEDVFGLYTTIFQSSKRDTNEQTGQLGLGSKSPFAYTDSFSVKTWLNGERRVYLAHLATDGVPALTHVSTTPSDEPQGLEVTFAAKREDMRAFQKEMQFVAMGYDAKSIEVHGMAIRLMDARAKGTNWAIYPRGAFGDELRHSHFIRQGSALYPSDYNFPNVGYGFITITEIPIGTASVTSSRDALSYDGETRRVIQNVHSAAYAELKAQVDAVVNGAKTRIEKAKVYAEYNGLLTNMRGSTMVSILRDEDRSNTGEIPGDVLEQAAHFGKSQTVRGAYNRYAHQFDIPTLPKMIVLVNDAENKIVRRTKRIRNVALSHAFAYVLDQPVEAWEMDKISGKRKFGGKKLYPRKAAIAWLKECLELTDAQFVLVSSLPDDPPVKSNKPAGPKVKRVLKPGQSWMQRVGGRVISPHYGESDRGPGEWGRGLRQAAEAAGIKLVWEEIFWVTEAQQARLEKKGELPPARRLDNVIHETLVKKAAASPLDDAQTMIAIRRNVGEYNRALPVVMAEFFPNLKITTEQADQTIHLAEMAKIDLRNRPIVAKIDSTIKELIGQYPLLFQKSDRAHYEHYVTAVKASTTKEAVK